MPLFDRLQKALQKLLTETENLGRLPTSYGWNEAEEKVAIARKEYDDALRAIKVGFLGHGYGR